MANYTDDEVNSAVAKIVRSTISHPSGILGNRDTQTTFNELQEAAAGVFVLYYNAPFYCIKLGTTRLVDYAQAQDQTLAQLIDAVQATNHLVTPIKDISSLANANAALEALGSAVSKRKDGFQDITQVAAYVRYSKSINQFVQDGGGNIKTVQTDPSTGVTTSSVNDTPAGARSKIPGLVTSMQSQQQDLISRVGQLANAWADYSAMNLLQNTAQGVISRASDVLKGHYDAMAAQDENTRLTNLRAVMLDLLAQQPIVAKYGAALAPGEFVPVNGHGKRYSDDTNLSTPAAITCDIQGPYAITAANQFIRFTIDGGAYFDFPLPIGMIASISGTLTEPYTIIDDATLAANNKVSVLFDDPNAASPTTVSITLSAGGSLSSTALAAEINAELVGIDLICERSFYPLRFHSLVTTEDLGGNNARFRLLGGSLAGLGVKVGDELDIITGADAGSTWTINFVDPAGLYMEGLGAETITPVVLPDDIEVKVGPAARALSLQDTNADASLNMRRTIRILNTDTASSNGAATLGWIPGMESRSRPIAAKDLAKNISLSSTAITASAVFQVTHYSGRARADAANAGIVVLSKLQAEGSITDGYSVVFTPVAGVDLSVVHIYDHIVVRSSNTLADVNVEGLITGLTATTISASMSSSITAGEVGIEVGPGLIFHFGDILNVTAGNNQGRYPVRESQGVGTTCSLEVPIENPLPIPLDGASPAVFHVDFGAEYVSFQSRLKQVSSRVQIDNAPASLGANYFFYSSSLPSSTYGTTAFLQFDQWPAAVEASDLILIYQTDLAVVARTFEVVDATSGANLRVLKISPEIESTADYDFSANLKNPPFARIRVAKVADYATLKAGLDTWLAAPQQQTQFFRDLARYLNPVLLNSNPTNAEVNMAVNQLQQLRSSLTSMNAALAVYTAPIEPAVDALLSSFRDKGSDRAIDLLLSGQFSAFFGLDMESTSYAGALTKSTRALVATDLPIRKTDRTKLNGQVSIGVIPNEKDFEFSADDADSPDTPDIPVGPNIDTPGASY